VLFTSESIGKATIFIQILNGSRRGKYVFMKIKYSRVT
jgi:hypothetical protein